MDIERAAICGDVDRKRASVSVMRFASKVISKSLVTVSGKAKMPGFSFISGERTVTVTFRADSDNSLRNRAASESTGRKRG